MSHTVGLYSRRLCLGALLLTSVYPMSNHAQPSNRKLHTIRHHETLHEAANDEAYEFRDFSTYIASEPNIEAQATGSLIFKDQSQLTTTASQSVHGNVSFHDKSILNSTAPHALNKRTRISLYDSSVFNAQSSHSISDSSAVQLYDQATFNANHANAITGQSRLTANSKVFNLSDQATLNANTEHAINGATIGFFKQASLSANASHAIDGGEQYFSEDTQLIAQSSRAITGGNQSLHDRARMIVKSPQAIDGGSQVFHEHTTLELETSDAIHHGKQSFFGEAQLNATATKSIQGGTQVFSNQTKLQASQASTLNSGSQFFFDTAELNATARDAITGGKQSFTASSKLNASETHAIRGGSQSFFESAILNAEASNSILEGIQEHMDSSQLLASASNAIAGGQQKFTQQSKLIANSQDAIHGGEQTFYDQSLLLTSHERAIHGGHQTFIHDSELALQSEQPLQNKPTANTALEAVTNPIVGILNGGQQTFRDNAKLTAAIGHSVTAGTQDFYEKAQLHASHPNAIVSGIQNFHHESTLDASAANAIRGGIQSFLNESHFHAQASHSISGGDQLFFGDADLTLNATKALAEGKQSFAHNTQLRANHQAAILSGTQSFHHKSSLHANAVASISGGRQSFHHASQLVANSPQSIHGGEQHFHDQSTLKALAPAAIAQGSIYFSDQSKLIAAADAIAGGHQTFSGDSQLLARAHHAILGGTQTLTQNSALVLKAQDALSPHHVMEFDHTAGGSGGQLSLNGFNTSSGRIYSKSLGSGVIQNRGDRPAQLTLNLENHDPSVFSGMVRDGGSAPLSLHVLGGTLKFDGSATHTGGTSMTNAKVILGAENSTAWLGGTVNVQSLATLSGTGIIGSGQNTALRIHKDGKLSPGHPIGTMRIDGHLVFEPGSTLLVDVNPDGSESDLLQVSGNTEILGGELIHTGLPGRYETDTPYTILKSAGPITGRFDTVRSVFAYLEPTLLYDTTERTIKLTLQRNAVPFDRFSQTENQQQTAVKIQHLPHQHPLYKAFAQSANDATQIRAHLNALTGEIYSAIPTAHLEESSFIRNAIRQHLRMLRIRNTRLWARGFSIWGFNKNATNTIKLDRETTGLMIGSDSPVGSWQIGTLAAYSRSTFQLKQSASSANSDNYHVGLYAQHQKGPLVLRTGAVYSWHDLHTQRSVTIPNISNLLKTNYQAHTVQAFGELGIKLRPSETFHLEPFISFAFAKTATRSLQESGGMSALSVSDSLSSASYGTMGLKAEQRFSFSNGTMASTHALLGWQRVWGNSQTMLKQSFLAGQPFHISGLSLPLQSAILEAGLQVCLSPQVNLDLSWQGQFSTISQQQSFKAQLHVLF